MRWRSESKAPEVLSQFLDENVTDGQDFILEENCVECDRTLSASLIFLRAADLTRFCSLHDVYISSFQLHCCMPQI